MATFWQRLHTYTTSALAQADEDNPVITHTDPMSGLVARIIDDAEPGTHSFAKGGYTYKWARFVGLLKQAVALPLYPVNAFYLGANDIRKTLLKVDNLAINALGIFVGIIEAGLWLASHVTRFATTIVRLLLSPLFIILDAITLIPVTRRLNRAFKEAARLCRDNNNKTGIFAFINRFALNFYAILYFNLAGVKPNVVTSSTESNLKNVTENSSQIILSTFTGSLVASSSALAALDHEYNAVEWMGEHVESAFEAIDGELGWGDVLQDSEWFWIPGADLSIVVSVLAVTVGLSCLIANLTTEAYPKLNASLQNSNQRCSADNKLCCSYWPPISSKSSQDSAGYSNNSSGEYMPVKNG